MTRRAIATGIVALLVLMLVRVGTAHEGVTSKFTYNADVYPVFLKRCGGCHVDGGVGPMSLLKYEDAFPWAESLRAELLDAAKGDPHDFVKAAHRQISGRELDIVLNWATGGTPEGDKAQTPQAPPFEINWASGPPDLTAAMPSPYTMNATVVESTHEAALPIQTPSSVTIGSVDLLPGNPSIVRSAVLTLRSPDGTVRVLGTWMPRQVPAAVALKPSVRIDPGSQIVAQVRYKKNWKQEGQPVSDLSQVGLYLAK
jgi:hypothetical protein